MESEKFLRRQVLLTGIFVVSLHDGDFPFPRYGQNACGLRLFPGEVLLFYQIQDFHHRLTVVKEITLSGMAGHFLPCSLGLLGPLLQNVPLGGRRQGNPEALLELLDPVERKPAAILQDSDHGGGAFVVFLRTGISGGICRKNRTVEVAAQLFQFATAEINRVAVNLILDLLVEKAS
jgi:hypothetical protein